MRLWSIHPSYLDPVGLIACWREAKLALAVLENRTKGYKNHSQLVRFKSTDDPVLFLKMYLKGLYDESIVRGYKFDKTCIAKSCEQKMQVTESQILYEYRHLMNKLTKRNPKYCLLTLNVRPHPLFEIVDGDIEHWERI